MLESLISAARQTLWSDRAATPVNFTLGRKYLRCSDTVYTVPGTHVIKRATHTVLEIEALGIAKWANGDVGDLAPQIDRKGLGIVRYCEKSNTTKLSGPWNTFDSKLNGTGCSVKEGDVVRLRVAPVVHNIAPGEFSVGVRAVDVMLVN